MHGVRTFLLNFIAKAMTITICCIIYSSLFAIKAAVGRIKQTQKKTNLTKRKKINI